jgi:hypothetical protein
MAVSYGIQTFDAAGNLKMSLSSRIMRSIANVIVSPGELPYSVSSLVITNNKSYVTTDDLFILNIPTQAYTINNCIKYAANYGSYGSTVFDINITMDRQLTSSTDGLAISGYGLEQIPRGNVMLYIIGNS